ncbi:hypothetical protein GOV03_04270 [Candidatus Woesearchaeota archaeon]|nr:hypothetical protein [Candidatus Woesearchaeota archaeon]
MINDEKIAQFRDWASRLTSTDREYLGRGIYGVISPEGTRGFIVKRPDWLTVYVLKDGLTPQQEREAWRMVEHKYAFHEQMGEPDNATLNSDADNITLNSNEMVRQINKSLKKFVLENYATRLI